MICLRDTSGTWPSQGLKIEWPMQEELTRGLVRALSTNHFHPCQSFDIVQWAYSDNAGIYFFLLFSVFLFVTLSCLPFSSPSVFSELDPPVAESEYILQYAALVTLQIASGKNTTANIALLIGLGFLESFLSDVIYSTGWVPRGAKEMSLLPQALVWRSSVWRGWAGG